MYDKKDRKITGRDPDGNDLFIEDDEELEEELTPEEDAMSSGYSFAVNSPHYCRDPGRRPAPALAHGTPSLHSQR